jgi:hypothetical protein
MAHALSPKQRALPPVMGYLFLTLSFFHTQSHGAAQKPNKWIK